MVQVIVNAGGVDELWVVQVNVYAGGLGELWVVPSMYMLVGEL